MSGLPRRVSRVAVMSVNGRERAELGVGDESLLARTELLHRRQQLGVAIGRDLEPELLGLQPDRVDPALLAEHDPPLGADESGGIRLDRRWIVELARNGAALAREEVLTRDRRP